MFHVAHNQEYSEKTTPTHQQPSTIEQQERRNRTSELHTTGFTLVPHQSEVPLKDIGEMSHSQVSSQKRKKPLNSFTTNNHGSTHGHTVWT
jgi:hypothetical protein